MEKANDFSFFYVDSVVEKIPLLVLAKPNSRLKSIQPKPGNAKNS
jgi:hypothetical protein